LNGFSEEKAVGRLAGILALECGETEKEAGMIKAAAAMHDTGKQKIDAAILNKPGKLTAREFEIMKTHTVLGAEMLKSVQGELGEMARQIALWHHERWDKTGYWGKDPRTLPRYLRYVSLADVFTALLSVRAYKHAWPPEEALAYIGTQSGAIFDPLAVEAFIPLVRNDPRVRALYGEVMQFAGGY
jgi:putative two-component system response regulator